MLAHFREADHPSGTTNNAFGRKGEVEIVDSLTLPPIFAINYQMKTKEASSYAPAKAGYVV